MKLIDITEIITFLPISTTMWSRVVKTSIKSLYLGVCFLFLFLSYATIQSFMTVMFGSLGYYSYAAIYIPYAFSSILAPFVGKRLGIKASLLLGAVSYVFWLLCINFKNWPLIIVASCVNGFGSGLLWNNQGIYMNSMLNTMNDKEHSGLIGGIFFSLYIFNQALGNILVIILMKSSVDFWITSWVMLAISMLAWILLILIPNPELLDSWQISWNHLTCETSNNEKDIVKFLPTRQASSRYGDSPYQSPRARYKIPNPIPIPSNTNSNSSPKIRKLSKPPDPSYPQSEQPQSEQPQSEQPQSERPPVQKEYPNLNEKKPSVRFGEDIDVVEYPSDEGKTLQRTRSLSERLRRNLNIPENTVELEQCFSLRGHFKNMCNVMRLPRVYLLFPRYILIGFSIIYSNGVLPVLFSDGEILRAAYFFVCYGGTSGLMAIIWGKLYDKYRLVFLHSIYLLLCAFQYIWLIVYLEILDLQTQTQTQTLQTLQPLSEWYILMNAVLAGILDAFNITTINMTINRYYEKRYSPYLFAWYRTIYCLFMAFSALLNIMIVPKYMTVMILLLTIVTDLFTAFYQRALQ